MASILFVGETYIKNKTPLSNNIDIHLITDSIEFAQDSVIQDILGTNLYNDLQTKYSAQTLSTIETTLVELIKPALSYASAESAMPFIQTQIRAKGLNHLDSDNATQADISYMRYLRGELKSRSEFYQQRIIKFLCNNTSSFPLYTAENTDIEASSKVPYDCDLFFNTNSCDCDKSCDC